MLKARKDKEVVLRMANEIGVLAKISKIVAERGVNILAMSCWVEGGQGVIRLVTDDNLRTTDALKKNGYDPHEEDVITIDAAHKPGILRHIADALAFDGINIEHLYASATIDQDVCFVILRASNNERAIVLLND